MQASNPAAALAVSSKQGRQIATLIDWFPDETYCRRDVTPLCLTPQRTLFRNENMSLRKVYGGTPVGTESRCDTCTHARIIQGYAESERIVICTGMYDPIRVPFKVMQCTDYEDRRLPDFNNMKEIAWQIRTKSAGSIAGFVTMPEEPDQQTETEPEEIPAASETK